MMVLFYDHMDLNQDVLLAAVSFSSVPRVGDTVHIRLVSRNHASDPFSGVIFRVERVEFIAHNAMSIQAWMQHIWSYADDANALLYVSAMNEETKKYIQSVKKGYEEY